MHRKSILIIALLLCGVATAQNFPDAPGVSSSTSTSATGSQATFENASQSGAPAAARKPWIDPKTADLNYWGATSALLGTTVLNVELTARCANQHTCLTFIASSSTERDLYLYTLPTDAALSYLTYKLKAKKRWWILPDAIVSAANIFSAGRSYGRLNVYTYPPKSSTASRSPGQNSGQR
jgi:hypothetical protein